MSLAFNIDVFDRVVDITDECHLHFWGADISMQFCKENVWNVCFPDLYTINAMRLKLKYGMAANSAKGGRAGDKKHFGDYGRHFKVFQRRFGWDWENRKTFNKVKGRYRGTHLLKFWGHDLRKGPVRSFDL